MAEPKNTGKGKGTIGGIVIAVILFLLIHGEDSEPFATFSIFFRKALSPQLCFC